jgi:hypothetical protein
LPVATTPGERLAAEAALARIKGHLADAQRTAAAIELNFSIADPGPGNCSLRLPGATA